MKPTMNRLLVRVEQEVAPKEGEAPKGNSVMVAEVLKVGPKVSGEIKVGDRVVFSPFGFDEIEVAAQPSGDEKEKLVVICEDMILVVYEK